MRIVQSLLIVAVLASPAASFAQQHHPPAAELGIQAGLWGIGPRIALNVSPRTAVQFEASLLNLHEGLYTVGLRHTPDPAFNWNVAGGVIGLFRLPQAGYTRGPVSVGDSDGALTPPLGSLERSDGGS